MQLTYMCTVIYLLFIFYCLLKLMKNYLNIKFIQRFTKQPQEGKHIILAVFNAISYKTVKITHPLYIG